MRYSYHLIIMRYSYHLIIMRYSYTNSSLHLTMPCFLCRAVSWVAFLQLCGVP